MDYMKMLDELAQGYDVTVTSHTLESGAKEWSVTITGFNKHVGSTRHTYVGPSLKKLVAAAWAGEPSGRRE